MSGADAEDARTRPGEVKVDRMAEDNDTVQPQREYAEWSPPRGWMGAREGLIECTSEEDHCAGERYARGGCQCPEPQREKVIAVGLIGRKAHPVTGRRSRAAGAA